MMLLPLKQILFALLGGFSLILLVHAEDDQSGFISIDCGRTQNSSYTEKTTGINYISDTGFIDTGESKLVLRYVKDIYQQPYWGVRSFPEGIRNCYKINVTSGDKYLIRASFVYGNYDSKDELPTFLLHLGTDLWDSVKVENVSLFINKELIHVPLRNYIHVCLVNNGSGVPFISALELRRLNITSYQTQIGSLALNRRLDIGQIAPDLKSYRYPKDIYDRFWYPYEDVDNQWLTLDTSFTVDFDKHNSFQPASIVMSTAATSQNPNVPLNLWWDPPIDADDTEYYVYMHFAEIEQLQSNESRMQYITNHGELYRKSFAASYLYTTTIYSRTGLRGGQNFSIIKDDNSTLPPSINGVEVYTLKEFLELETKQEDVEAITNVKSTYEITKNWQGDPCLPLNYSWEGLKCSYPEDDSPRIISLDLSMSGLTGEISHSISNLAMIQTLDLSNNNLTGPIPDFLSQLPDLNVLNLEKNKFTGSLPLGLVERRKNGLLSISLCDNPNLAANESCTTKKKNKSIIPIIGAIAGISTLMLAGAVFFCFCKKKRLHAAIDSKPNPGSVELEQKNRKFTYSEILKITNNRQRVLGKGGFGTVYHGYIDDKTQVAVKLLSPSSSQGLQQFHAEVHLLMRVHHTNLTSLVGYCDDEINKGLVYEYMANGNLQAFLSDQSSGVLTWEGRLQIATEAAQGLEYLHYGCKPAMIHRDVKSTNILLNEKFKAKLSDFGLSRNFASGDVSHIVTCVAGTPGYLAPEYHQSNRLNEKSDVYSFGIVLLEIITGQPVYSRTNGERTHIIRWVELMLLQGDIYSIIDPMLERTFNVNSAWKAIEIAMACVSAEASKRPVMSNVVMELKKCLPAQLDLTNHSSYETELGSSIDVVSQNNSITMMCPSVR
ncbi:senescence-induced receptor-like serine/threonine-protein kinase isoform X2 [Rosa chinensis]|uniref:senescence-induced receptor-like serine/threonine-protein kinase isoform X2 n=1 Tax=Rosa chinensis TaxID=74649 RepID=UPI000D091F5B|nr:senescence-induced receptor-like serine/threonine-protein kinase isoform X2 [Rosa chinensis]